MATEAQARAWLTKLSAALDARARDVANAEAWYDGDHPVPDPPPNTFPAVDREARAAFTAMAKLGVTNFLGPVVDVPTSKLRIEGFRFGSGTRATDQQAWTIFQRNGMDGDSDLLNEAAVKVGQSAVTVWGDSDGKAVITAEDPSQVVVAYEPGAGRRRRAAALKRWVDDDGFTFATLYLPEEIWKFRSRRKTTVATTTGMGNLVLPSSVSTSPEWQPREIAGEAWPLSNPLGEVLLVELATNTDLRFRPFGGGKPEFARVVTDQRRINQTMLNLLVTLEFQSFRQRWVTGWRPPTNPKTGEADRYATMKAAASAMAIFDSKDAKVGEFSQADFRPIIDVIGADVKKIAATTSTPPYAYLIGDMVNVAADALARIEGNQVAKVQRHARQLGERHEEYMRLALKAEGNVLAADTASSVQWAELESRTSKELVELAKEAKAMGLPPEVYLAYMPGIDQQEARRLAIQMAGAELLANTELDQVDEQVGEPVA